MKFIDLQYIQTLAKDQSIAIGERFGLSNNEIEELEKSLLFVYEMFTENN